jgi:hypothetical protein
VKAVATRDDVATQLVLISALDVADSRLVDLKPDQAYVLAVEHQGVTRGEARRDQILDHLGLILDRDSAPAGQIRHRDMVALTVEAQMDASMDQTFARHSLSHPGGCEHVAGPLFEHAGPDPRFHVGPASCLEDDRVDPMSLEQMAQKQPSRANSDNRYLRSFKSRHQDEFRPSVDAALLSSPVGLS